MTQEERPMEREQTLEMDIVHELEKCVDLFREWQSDSRKVPELPSWMAYRECADKLRVVVEDIKTEVFKEHKYE